VKAWFREKAADDSHQPALALQNMEAAKRIVEQGYGITIIPETAVRREIEAGLLKRLQVEEFDLSVDYHLFYFKGKVLSRAAEAFLETLCDLKVFSNGENLRGKPWKNP
jgi:DNA-binding transcriptional LysR family regulator